MNNCSMKLKRMINIALGALLCVFMILFITSCVKSPDLSGILVLKICTSVCFVLDGMLWIDWKSKKRKQFPMILFFGFVFMMLGDYFIYSDFTAGAIAFAIGHIFYVISYYTIHAFERMEILLMALLFLLAFLVIRFTPILQFEPSFMIYVCLSYAVILSLMTGKSITNYLKVKNPLTLCVCIGSVLFFLSDIMVLFHAFAIDKWIYTHI